MKFRLPVILFQTAVLLSLAAVGPAAETPALDVAAFKMDGTVTLEGKTLVLKTAFAEWRPNSNQLMIYLYPFEITPPDLATYLKTRRHDDLNKANPDPSKWKAMPWVILSATFGRGDHSPTLANMTASTIASQNFKFDGSSNTISGEGFKLFKSFQSFTAKGTAVGDSVELSVSFSQAKPECKIQLKGKTRIIH